ncbi:MAG TPA: Mov34/MPN/PAD-1 family protein [Candidatus Binatia bacterium]
MDEQGARTLTYQALEEISRHAQEAFPEECCGLILHRNGTDTVRRCANIQNKLHALDPLTYPRDATIAYAMDFKELDAILKQADESRSAVKAFYHSHPGHGAYFSAEDKGFACPFGEPTYPETAQIVISIYDRVVKEICAYAWSPREKDFVQIPLVPLGEAPDS